MVISQVRTGHIQKKFVGTVAQIIANLQRKLGKNKESSITRRPANA